MSTPEYQVVAGPRSPEALRVNETSADLDFTTIASATLLVFKPGGSVNWPVTIVNPTSRSAQLVHVFAAGDADVGGELYTVEPVFTLPDGGIRRGTTFRLRVV